MTIRCLLVDDEPPALKVLQSHIANIHGLVVAGLCKNAMEALDILHEKTVDLIFLDIKMPKLIGTDFLRSLPRPPRVIFVTAYREYAVDSYELDAVDYLVKPVSFERFLKAVGKVKRLMGQETAIHPSEYGPNPESFVYLKVDRNMQKIMINEILYIEGWKDYVKVFLINGKTFLVKQSISSIENLLAVHKFLRVHRSFIVSLERVTGYNSLAVQLEKTEIPIGRLYKHHVMNVIHPG
jgi:DNA-binding LytR/AlgR family response regulator